MNPKQNTTKAVIRSLIITLLITTCAYAIINPPHTINNNINSVTNYITWTINYIPTTLIFLTTIISTIIITSAPQIIMLIKPFKLPKVATSSAPKNIMPWTLCITLITFYITAIGLSGSIQTTNSPIEATNLFVLDYKNILLPIFSLNLLATCLYCTLNTNWKTTPLRRHAPTNNQYK
jgi:hypothetical protein